MEIFFGILAAIFAVISSIFGVRNRIHRSSNSGTRCNIRNDRTRYNDLVSNSERLERAKDRIQELGRRDADNIRKCAKISERIRKKEPEADATE